jgi:hypothetical protein
MVRSRNRKKRAVAAAIALPDSLSDSGTIAASGVDHGFRVRAEDVAIREDERNDSMQSRDASCMSYRSH